MSRRRIFFRTGYFEDSYIKRRRNQCMGKTEATSRERRQPTGLNPRAATGATVKSTHTQEEGAMGRKEGFCF